MWKFPDLWPSSTNRENILGEFISDKLVGSKTFSGNCFCNNFGRNGIITIRSGACPFVSWRSSHLCFVPLFLCPRMLRSRRRDVCRDLSRTFLSRLICTAKLNHIPLSAMGSKIITHTYTRFYYFGISCQLHKTSVAQGSLAGIILCNLGAFTRCFLWTRHLHALIVWELIFQLHTHRLHRKMFFWIIRVIISGLIVKVWTWSQCLSIVSRFSSFDKQRDVALTCWVLILFVWPRLRWFLAKSSLKDLQNHMRSAPKQGHICRDVWAVAKEWSEVTGHLCFPSSQCDFRKC